MTVLASVSFEWVVRRQPVAIFLSWNISAVSFQARIALSLLLHFLTAYSNSFFSRSVQKKCSAKK